MKPGRLNQVKAVERGVDQQLQVSWLAFDSQQPAAEDGGAQPRTCATSQRLYNVLRALTAPQILLPNGQSHRLPTAGSRDPLCTLIDASVIEASERGSEDADDQRIEVRTDAGHLLTIPLNSSSRVGPEAAHLVPADDSGRLETADMWVW